MKLTFLVTGCGFSEKSTEGIPKCPKRLKNLMLTSWKIHWKHVLFISLFGCFKSRGFVSPQYFTPFAIWWKDGTNHQEQLQLIADDMAKALGFFNEQKPETWRYTPRKMNMFEAWNVSAEVFLSQLICWLSQWLTGLNFWGITYLIGKNQGYIFFLGGGNLSMFYVYPEIRGEMIQFDEHIFQMGWFNHQRSVIFCSEIDVHRCLWIWLSWIWRDLQRRRP